MATKLLEVGRNWPQRFLGMESAALLQSGQLLDPSRRLGSLILRRLFLLDDNECAKHAILMWPWDLRLNLGVFDVSIKLVNRNYKVAPEHQVQYLEFLTLDLNGI